MNRYSFDKERHIHLLDNKPLYGASTVGNVLDKNLTWWSAELSAVTALESGEHIPTIRAEYLDAVNSDDKKKAIDKLQKKYPIFKEARFAHFNDKNTKAEKGTDLHSLLEMFVKYQMKLIPSSTEYHSQIKPFVEWAKINVKRFIASEAYCYNEDLWVGGICDCVAELNNGSLVIIDFKSSKEAYFSQFIQTAGYASCIEHSGLLTENGDKLPIQLDRKIDELIIFPFGAKELKPYYNKLSIDKTKKAFESCVTLHKLIQEESL